MGQLGDQFYRAKGRAPHAAWVHPTVEPCECDQCKRAVGGCHADGRHVFEDGAKSCRCGAVKAMTTQERLNYIAERYRYVEVDDTEKRLADEARDVACGDDDGKAALLYDVDFWFLFRELNKALEDSARLDWIDASGASVVPAWSGEGARIGVVAQDGAADGRTERRENVRSAIDAATNPRCGWCKGSGQAGVSGQPCNTCDGRGWVRS